MNQRNSVIQMAQNEVGNHLNGVEFWRWYGYTSYVPWCAVFVSWCLDQAGLDCGDLRPYIYDINAQYDAIDYFEDKQAIISKGCVQMYVFYSRYGMLLPKENVQAGDLIFIEWTPEIVNDTDPNTRGVDHVAIVEYTEVLSDGDILIHSIDGNSDATGENNVTRRTRRCSDPHVYAVARPRYIVSDDSHQNYERVELTSRDTLEELAISRGLTCAEVIEDSNYPEVIYIRENGRRDWVRRFQQVIVDSGIANIYVDGIWGNQTETAAASAVAYSGTSGLISTFAQVMLDAHGYSIVIDGDFGPASSSTLLEFQNDHGLTGTSRTDVNTWKKLLHVS